MRRFLGYTRDDDGKVIKRHVRKVSNTIHSSIGGGGNTDGFIIEIRRYADVQIPKG